MNTDYELLFTPYKIGECEIKNRFIMPGSNAKRKKLPPLVSEVTAVL